MLTQRRQVEQSRRFSQGLVEAQEAERSRIARELHDDIIQRIALLGGELSGLARTIPEPTEAVTQRIEGLRDELHDLADEVRQMARRAHPAVLDHLGLVKAVRNLAGEMATSDGLDVGVDVTNEPALARLSPAAALSLFRVTQEGLRNVVRHSGTLEAKVRLGARESGVFVAIEDKGQGMDPNSADEQGLGLLGLNERLRAVQGRLTIESAPGEGTRLVAWVPQNGNTTS
ncbi:MAG: sensor histidine kinase [Gemmatimonadota bacterium]